MPPRDTEEGADFAVSRVAELAAASLPTVRLSRADFARYLAAHEAGRELLASPDAEGAAERASELWLAAAIAAGDNQAIAIFEDRYVAPLERTLSRMKLAASELDEIKQLVREKLLVRADGVHARVEEYAGRGKLGGLVQVVATREALSLLRRTNREVLAGDDDLAAPLIGDPGLEMLKGRTRDAFRVAFAHAAVGLTPRQRNLLRMHLLSGVTLERLAAIHDVHRATIVRWLADAREHVRVATKKALASSLHVRADEVESLMALVESQLDVSLERLLMPRDDHDDGDDDRGADGDRQ